MLNGAQIRAARAALGWSGSDLANASSISLRTITKIETSEVLPNVTLGTLTALKTCLEAQGIEFITTSDGSPGIVIRAQGRQPS